MQAVIFLVIVGLIAGFSMIVLIVSGSLSSAWRWIISACWGRRCARLT
jgi:hypothetical protein